MLGLGYLNSGGFYNPHDILPTAKKPVPQRVWRGLSGFAGPPRPAIGISRCPPTVPSTRPICFPRAAL